MNIMATVECNTPMVLDTRHQGIENVINQSKRAEHEHFHVLEKITPGSSDRAIIQCGGNLDGNGRVVLFQTRNGTEAIFVFDNTASGIALSFRSNRGNQVDIFHVAKQENSHEESSYAGRLVLKHGLDARSYEFINRIGDTCYTAACNEASIMRFLVMKGTKVVSTFNIQPSCLDISVLESLKTRESAVLLGIAYSIWRLIPHS